MQLVKKAILFSVISSLSLGLPFLIARAQFNPPVNPTDSSLSTKASTIKIGMSAPFTGASSGISIEQYRGAIAYFNYVNDNGGINGKTIQLQAYDDGYTPLLTIKNTIRLIEDDNVFALFQYFGTPNVTRTLPLLNRFKDSHIYLFFPYTGAQPPRQEPYRQFVFNLRPSYREETEGLVDQLVKIGRKRIAVFYQMDGFGRSSWNGVRQALAKRNLKIVAEATYYRNTSFSESFQPHVETLREANPDAVILAGLYAPCAGFIRDARNANWDIPIVSVSVGGESLVNLLMEAGQKTGKDYTTNLIHSQVFPSYKATELPAVREYRSLMDRYRPLPPRQLIGNREYAAVSYSFDSMEGFLNAKLLVEVLKRMNSSSSSMMEQRAQIPQAAEQIQNLDIGIETPLSFGKSNNQALNEVYYTEIAKGQFVRLTNWERWAKR